MGAPVQASCGVFPPPRSAARTSLFWGGGEGRGGTHITNLICFLQHKWELARASPLASGTGPTPLPRCSSMCQAPSLLFPRASVSMTCGFQLS